MIPIFHYFDYQKYLADYYECRKKVDPYFTYRYIASKVGIDHAFIVKVFQGSKHIALKTAPLFSKLLKHSKREQEYFELLILFSRAKSDTETKHYFAKLISYIEFSPLKIEGYKFEFYQKWYYTAVREIIGFAGFNGDYKNLGLMLQPPITESQARRSVALLENLGFIQRNKDGEYSLVTRFITPSEEIQPLAIREFQKETMLLAIDALQNIPKADRHISTVTLSLSVDGEEKIKECVLNFRNEIQKVAQQDSAVSKAFQINVQLFPISQRAQEEHRE
jgi:uncharacterized protein (TIGR02147 family)